MSELEVELVGMVLSHVDPLSQPVPRSVSSMDAVTAQVTTAY
jgi:hypothetical protein